MCWHRGVRNYLQGSNATGVLLLVCTKGGGERSKGMWACAGEVTGLLLSCAVRWQREWWDYCLGFPRYCSHLTKTNREIPSEKSTDNPTYYVNHCSWLNSGKKPQDVIVYCDFKIKKVITVLNVSHISWMLQNWNYFVTFKCCSLTCTVCMHCSLQVNNM